VENDLQAIVAQAEASQADISNRSDWDQAKASILGPKGTLTQASKLIGTLPREEKPAFGQALNQAKKQVEALFSASLSRIEEQADLHALGESYDPTLPAIPNRSGSLHPLSATRRKVVSTFRKLGFTVTEATEAGNRMVLLRCAQHS
jgi:phenylalanyl-tRNA synthetase alpha chain